MGNGAVCKNIGIYTEFSGWITVLQDQIWTCGISSKKRKKGLHFPDV